MADLRPTSINSILPATSCPPRHDGPYVIVLKGLGVEAEGAWNCAFVILAIFDLLVIAFAFCLGIVFSLWHYLIMKPRYRREIEQARLAVREATLRLQSAEVTVTPVKCPVSTETTITESPPRPDNHDILAYVGAANLSAIANPEVALNPDPTFRVPQSSHESILEKTG